MQSNRTAAAVAGVGLVVGVIVLTRNKAKAASAPSSRELEPDTPSDASSTRPRLPSSTAQEGEPLAWDQREHPLADRGLEDAIDVQEVPFEDASPVPSLPASSPASLPAPAAPPAPSSKPKAKPKAKAKPSAPLASSPAPAPPPAPTSSPASSAARSPEQAARELLAHAEKLQRAGRMSELGTRGKPSAIVLAAQRDMGLTPDGIYGPDTRARGRELINKNFPVRK